MNLDTNQVTVKVKPVLYIAARTALTSRRTDGSRASRSPAVGVAVAAVALSLTVMLCAIAVVGGFRQQITDKITGFNAHLQIYRVMPSEAGPEDDNVILLTPTLEGILNDESYIKKYDLELTVPAIFKTDNDFKGIYVKGADGHLLSDFLSTQLVSGAIPDFSSSERVDQIAVSQKIAYDLKLKVGDSIPTFYLHNDLMARRYIIAGIYATHFDTFDDVIALGSIDGLRSVTDIKPRSGVALRILTDDYRRAAEYGSMLQQRLNEAYVSGEIFVQYRVDTVAENGAAYFSWLNLLDTNVLVILCLMTVVACITLIAAMLILIIDKVSLIGILRALGASRGMVRHIFVILALRIALFGLLIGNSIGLILLWVQWKWHLLPLDAENYYIDFVPVRIDGMSVLILNGCVLAVVVMSLLLPSMLAGRISPASTMRAQD